MAENEIVTTDARALESWDGAANRALSAKRERDNIVKSVLTDELDYGIIPGTAKPTLFKAGAEKVCDALQVYPDYELVRTVEDWQTPLFNYAYRCRLRHRGTDIVVATGIGSCNSMEKKYRYRKDGTVNEDICSQVNTLDKMAQKRAMIQATLNFGFSQYFTQDLEDLEDANGKPPVEQPKRKSTGTAKRANDREWTGTIKAVVSRTGQTNNKPWTLYIVEADEEGTSFSTFDEKLMKVAMAASESGETCSIIWSPGKNDSKKLESIEIVGQFEEEVPLVPEHEHAS